MNFSMRKVVNYAACSVEHDGHTVDLGMLDRNEAKVLLKDFQSAVEDLEWFLQSTEGAE